jgi:hypothetical protein
MFGQSLTSNGFDEGQLAGCSFFTLLGGLLWISFLLKSSSLTADGRLVLWDTYWGLGWTVEVTARLTLQFA